jgi:hypothetical protein
MSTPTSIVEGFSISHAAILNGATGVEDPVGDIYGIRDGSLEPDFDSYDNTGDDAVLSTWFWFNYATVTISGGYIPFALIALMSGETLTSSGTGSTTVYELPIWTSTSLNVQPRPMVIRVPSKDQNGLIRTLDIVLYKVQFQPIAFTGPTYKDGLVVNYTGRALLSDRKENGVLIGGGARQIGRLISKP